MNNKKCPVWVLCLLFTFSIFIIPLIAGIILYIRNVMIDKKMKKQQTDHLDELSRSLANLEGEINNLTSRKAQRQTEYNEIIASKEALMQQMKQEAKIEAVKELEDNLAEAKKALEHLQADIELKEMMLNEKSAEYDRSCKSVENNAVKIEKLKSIYKSFQYAIKVYESGSDSKLNEALIDMADETLAPIIEMKLNCMNVKQLKKQYNDLQRSIQEEFKRYEGRYNTKANIAIYKLMVIALEAELQNVLYSLKYGKLEDSVEAVKSITARYLTIAVDGNQNIAPTMKKFIGEIEYLFIETVKVEYQYYIQKERIKEEQRAIKEQMKQEAAERKALEEQRKKVEKEEAKYQNEIQSVNDQLSNCLDNEQIQKLEERIRELQEQMAAVQDKKEKITQLQNGKAGFVYVISNLGSFGENVFKVGMTRRENPMDRVKELGDASVPFSFDVHSFIFTDDAVSLEATIHKELNDRRVNKINSRKEFFNVTLDEIEKLVYKYQPTAEFNRTMLAEEYRQGLTMKEPIPEFSDVENAELEDED